MRNPFRIFRLFVDSLAQIALELSKIRVALETIAKATDVIIPNRLLLVADAITKLQPRTQKIARVTITPGPTRPKGTKERPTMAGTQLDQSLEQDFATTYVRDDGTPNVTPDNVEHSAVTPETIAVFSLDPPAAGFTVVPLVTRGLGQVKIRYDRDLGAGDEEVEELFDVEIVGGTIASLAIAGGATRPKREIPTT